MARRKAGLVRVGHNIIAYACCICGASPGSGAAGGEWVLIMVVAMEEAVRAAPVLLGSRFCDANSMPYALGKVRSDDFFLAGGVGKRGCDRTRADNLSDQPVISRALSVPAKGKVHTIGIIGCSI